MRVKPFVRFLNYSHMMPTRYNLDVSDKLSKIIPDDSLTDREKAKAVRLVRVRAVQRRGDGEGALERGCRGLGCTACRCAGSPVCLPPCHGAAGEGGGGGGGGGRGGLSARASARQHHPTPIVTLTAASPPPLPSRPLLLPAPAGGEEDAGGAVQGAGGH